MTGPTDAELDAVLERLREEDIHVVPRVIVWGVSDDHRVREAMRAALSPLFEERGWR